MDGQVDGFNKALITRWPLEVGLICFPVLQTAYGVARSKCARFSLCSVTGRRLANSERGISADRKPTSGSGKQNIQKKQKWNWTSAAGAPWRLLFNQRQWNVRGVKVNLQCFHIEIRPLLSPPALLTSPDPERHPILPCGEVGLPAAGGSKGKRGKSTRTISALYHGRFTSSPPVRLLAASRSNWLADASLLCAERRALLRRDIGFSFFFFLLPSLAYAGCPGPFHGAH